MTAPSVAASNAQAALALDSEAYLVAPRHFIEASSRCNFLCPLRWTHNRRHGLLDYANFARFIDQAAPSLACVCFAGRGEPTLNPETLVSSSMCRRCKSRTYQQVESIITPIVRRKQCAR